MDLALFDFDGTLAEGESFGAFLRHAVPAARQRAIRLRVAPIVIAYRAGLVSGTTARARITRAALMGMPAARLADRTAAFASDVLPHTVRAAALARLQWHQARGDDVAVVSGAKSEYLQPWCDRMGVRLIASRLEIVDGHATGRYLGEQCVGAEKARRIRASFDFACYERVHAYGDTHEDAAMLALADEPHYRCMPPPTATPSCACRARPRRDR